jgi:hypothetical protein
MTVKAGNLLDLILLMIGGEMDENGELVLVPDAPGIKIADTVSVLTEGSAVRGNQVGNDLQVTWAGSAAVDTQKTVTIVKPEVPVSEYEVVVYNPSTVTDLTVKIFNEEVALGGGNRQALLTTVTVPKSQMLTGTIVNTYVRLISGMFVGTNCTLVLSNNIALGVSDGFSAYVRIREVM